MILPELVPREVSKMYLVNNALLDKSIKRLIRGLSRTRGLKTLCIVRNLIGPTTIKALAHDLLPSPACFSVKKLVLKDPYPMKLRRSMLSVLADQLCQAAPNLYHLRSLTLCKLGLDRSSIDKLAEGVSLLPSLIVLDLSANMLDHNSLKLLIDKLTFFSQIRSLDLSYNVVGPTHSSFQSAANSFEHSLSCFLHKSSCLLHLNISGMSLSIAQCLYIAKHGIRKSHTLLAVHMNGLGLQLSQVIALRRALKVEETLNENAHVDSQLLERHQVAKFSKHNVEIILGKGSLSSLKMATRSRDPTTSSQYESAKALAKAPLFKHDAQDKLVYQRVLGRPEMIGSHRWIEKAEDQCQVCRKMTYCLVIWNKHLSEAREHSFYFSSLNTRPVLFTKEKYLHPVLCTRDRVHKMLPISEFWQRLRWQSERVTNLRRCTDQQENERQHLITSKVKDKVAKGVIEPTFWSISTAKMDTHTLDHDLPVTKLLQKIQN